MSASLAEIAPAKINLTLRVLGRRANGYHELESLVVFADVGDTLALQPGGATALEITGPFAAACGPVADNLVLKAVTELRDRVSGLKAGKFVLDKRLPVAAGIGGGSADAAAALRLLARLNGIALDDKRLVLAAQAVGADVPVCLDPRPRVMRGIGDLLSEPFDIPPLSALLVNPGVPLATRDVFAAFAEHYGSGTKGYLPSVPRQQDALIDFLHSHGNDLTQAAIACAPAVSETLIALRALPAVRLIRMSGSGPTCFALFRTPGEAGAAGRRLSIDRKDWWVQPAKLS